MTAATAKDKGKREKRMWINTKFRREVAFGQEGDTGFGEELYLHF